MIRLVLTLTCGVCLAATAAIGQDARRAGENPKAVLPTLRRADALKSADALLAVSSAERPVVDPELPDPFYPTVKRTRKADAEPAAPALSTDYLIARAAESIKPQGTMLIGTEPYLLLDGKRFKAGDTIPVTVDGVGIQITVTSIQRNSYTLRLEDKELRREFK